MTTQPLRLPFDPRLKTATTLTGFCMTAVTFRYIEEAYQTFASLDPEMIDRKLLAKTVQEFYQGVPVDIRGDRAITIREAIYRVLSIGEFMISACRVYRTHRGRPFQSSVGVVNERYRAVSVIALLPHTTTADLAAFEELLMDIRKTDFSKPTRSDGAFNVLISRVMTEHVAPMARQMIKLKMRAVKNADRQQWILD